jgi:hypothetical protein
MAQTFDKVFLNTTSGSNDGRNMLVLDKIS